MAKTKLYYQTMRELNEHQHRKALLAKGIEPVREPVTARNTLKGDEREAVKWHKSPRNSKPSKYSVCPSGIRTTRWGLE